MIGQLDTAFISLPQCRTCCNCEFPLKETGPQQNYPKTKLDNTMHLNGRDFAENVIIYHIQTNDWLLCSAKFAYKNRDKGKWNNIHNAVSILRQWEFPKKLRKN